MKIASNAAIFSCCTGDCPTKWVQLNIYCSSMLKSSLSGARDCNLILKRFSLAATYIFFVFLFFFLLARLAQTIFVISHSRGTAGGGEAGAVAAGATHTMCPWLVGRSSRARFCVQPFQPFHPCCPRYPGRNPFFYGLRAWTCRRSNSDP